MVRSALHFIFGFSVLAVFSLSTPGAFAQCGSLGSPSTSALAAGGDFNTAGTWDNGVPSSSTNTCIINGTAGSPATVTLASSQTGNVLNLQVGANNTLTLSASSNFIVSGTQIVNDGSIGLDNTLVLANSVTLSGGGALTMTGGQIGTNSNSYTLTNQSLIQGYGALGSNAGADSPNLSLANSGTINANSGGNTLTIGGDGGSITNTGSLEATGGGILSLTSSASINNTGGVISANDPAIAVSTVDVSTTIQGGTLTTSGGGVMQTVGTAGLDGATHGAITISDGSTYTAGSGTVTHIAGSLILGTVTGGALALNGTAELVLTGNVTLSGPGSVTMTGGQVGTNSNGYTLTNQSIIQGYGLLGSNVGGDYPNLSLANSGTINANSSGNTLTIGGTGSSITNTGVLEATNGGTLVLSSTAPVLNQGANITATGAGSVVEVDNTTIQGGTLNTSAGGVMETVGHSGLDGASHGAITISDGSTYTAGGASDTLTDIAGSLILGTSAGGTLALGGQLRLTGDTTFSGPGTVTMTGGATGAQIGTNSNSYTLTNTTTIQGSGLIGSNTGSLYQNLSLNNSGTINANSSGNTLTIGGTGSSITNTGVLEATNGGTLILSTSASVLNQGGNITATGAGSVVEVDNTTIQGGTLNTSAGGVMETVGHSGLDGASHGAITIGDGSTYTAGGAAGTLTDIAGSLILGTSAGGTLALSSQLRLTGNTTFSGPGVVSISGPSNPNSAIGGQIGTNSNGYTLTNQSTIQGTGLIGSNIGLEYGNLNVTNSGIINALGGTLQIGGTGTLTQTATGTLAAQAGSTLLVSAALSASDFSGGKLSNGSYEAFGNGATLQIDSLGTSGGEIKQNAATIVLSGATAQITDGSGLNALSGLQSNSGSFTVEGGQAFVTTAGAFTNSGAMDVGGGSSSFTVPGAYTQTAGSTDIESAGTLTVTSFDMTGGTTQVDGSVEAAGGGLISFGAELFGTGDFAGNLISSGEIFAGDDPTPGTFTIEGDYSQTDNSSYVTDIDGTQGAPDIGVLDVQGNVTLDAGADLDIGALAFTPTFDQIFTILNYNGTLSGTFTLTGAYASDFAVLYSDPPDGGSVAVEYTANPPSSGTPEPASFWLVLGLLASAAVWKRRALIQLRAR